MVFGLTGIAATISGAARKEENLLRTRATVRDNAPSGFGGLFTPIGGKRGDPEAQIEGFTGGHQGGAVGVIEMSVWVVMMLAILVLDVGMAVLPAMLAAKCNPKHPILMGLVGFFFSEIYLFQFLFRKLVINEPGYCKDC
jgi:hypothetical protein